MTITTHVYSIVVTVMSVRLNKRLIVITTLNILILIVIVIAVSNPTSIHASNVFKSINTYAIQILTVTTLIAIVIAIEV